MRFLFKYYKNWLGVSLDESSLWNLSHSPDSSLEIILSRVPDWEHCETKVQGIGRFWATYNLVVLWLKGMMLLDGEATLIEGSDGEKLKLSENNPSEERVHWFRWNGINSQGKSLKSRRHLESLKFLLIFYDSMDLVWLASCLVCGKPFFFSRNGLEKLGTWLIFCNFTLSRKVS